MNKNVIKEYAKAKLSGLTKIFECEQQDDIYVCTNINFNMKDDTSFLSYIVKRDDGFIEITIPEFFTSVMVSFENMPCCERYILRFHKDLEVPCLAFSYPYVHDICFYEGSNVYDITDDAIIHRHAKSLILYLHKNKKRKNYNVPEGVEIIDSYAFWDAKNLKKIHIPSSLIYIEMDAFNTNIQFSVCREHPDFISYRGSLYAAKGNMLVRFFQDYELRDIHLYPFTWYAPEDAFNLNLHYVNSFTIPPFLKSGEELFKLFFGVHYTVRVPRGNRKLHDLFQSISVGKVVYYDL